MTAERAERMACARAVCLSCRQGIPHRNGDPMMHDNTDPRQPVYHECAAFAIWKRDQEVSA